MIAKLSYGWGNENYVAITTCNENLGSPMYRKSEFCYFLRSHHSQLAVEQLTIEIVDRGTDTFKCEEIDDAVRI